MPSLMVKRTVFLSLLLASAAHAEPAAKTVYVVDTHIIALRSEENNKSAVMRALQAATPVELLGVNKKSGFARVRMEDGTVGFILTRNLAKTPPKLTESEAAVRDSAALKSENAALKLELAKLKQYVTPGTSLEQSLAKERDRLAHELNTLKTTAAEAYRIKTERDDYQERYVQVEKEAKQLERENADLKDRTEQDWFLYGGIVSALGMLLGFVLPKLGWWRKSSSWDSF